MQEEFSIGDVVYYIGPDSKVRPIPEFGEMLIVRRVNLESILVNNPIFSSEISKKFLSKTPPAKEFLQFPFMYYIGNDPDELKCIGYGEKVEVVLSPKKYLDHPSFFNVKTSNGVIVVVNRGNLSAEPPAKEKSPDNKDSINRLSRAPSAYSTGSASDALRDLTDGVQKKQFEDFERAMYKVKYSSVMAAGREDDDPEYQNPTALILRQMADQIESGSKKLASMTIKNNLKEHPIEGSVLNKLTGHTIMTIEIFEDIAQ